MRGTRKRPWTIIAPHHVVQGALGLGLALSLAACELRSDEAGDAPSAPATATAADGGPVPEESASPVASIIRDDISPPSEVELPPEPVALVVPFPDGSDLDERGERLLAGILDSDAMAAGWPIIISGHTDSTGNDQANIRASRARAEAVAAWLVERGVADRRIKVVAFGEQNPIAPNALPDGTPNEQGRRTNRRVEVHIAPAPGPEASQNEETGNAPPNEDA